MEWTCQDPKIKFIMLCYNHEYTLYHSAHLLTILQLKRASLMLIALENVWWWTLPSHLFVFVCMCTDKLFSPPMAAPRLCTKQKCTVAFTSKSIFANCSIVEENKLCLLCRYNKYAVSLLNCDNVPNTTLDIQPSLFQIHSNYLLQQPRTTMFRNLEDTSWDLWKPWSQLSNRLYTFQSVSRCVCPVKNDIITCRYLTVSACPLFHNL